MKSVIIFAVLVAAAVAAPPSTNDAQAQILKQDSDNIGVDGYNYSWVFDDIFLFEKCVIFIKSDINSGVYCF